MKEGAGGSPLTQSSTPRAAITKEIGGDSGRYQDRAGSRGNWVGAATQCGQGWRTLAHPAQGAGPGGSAPGVPAAKSVPLALAGPRPERSKRGIWPGDPEGDPTPGQSDLGRTAQGPGSARGERRARRARTGQGLGQRAGGAPAPGKWRGGQGRARPQAPPPPRLGLGRWGPVMDRPPGRSPRAWRPGLLGPAGRSGGFGGAGGGRGSLWWGGASGE